MDLLSLIAKPLAPDYHQSLKRSLTVELFEVHRPCTSCRHLP